MELGVEHECVSNGYGKSGPHQLSEVTETKRALAGDPENLGLSCESVLRGLRKDLIQTVTSLGFF